MSPSTRPFDDNYEEPTKQHPVVPANEEPLAPRRPRRPVPPPPETAIPAGGGIPTPPNHPIQDLSEPPEEPKNQKWQLLLMGLLLGLLLGALATWLITKDNKQENSNTKIEKRLQRSQQANRQLRSDLSQSQTDLKEARSDLKKAKGSVDKSKDQVNQVEEEANQAAENLRSALRLVGQENYEEAKSTVEGNDQSEETVNKAIADNLAARALAEIAQDNNDSASDLLDQARDYPRTSLTRQAEKSLDKAQSQPSEDSETIAP